MFNLASLYTATHQLATRCRGRMRSRLQGCRPVCQRLWTSYRGMVLIAPSVTVLGIGLHVTGSVQFLEWAAYDQYFRLRPLEAMDKRIVVVTIDETDIAEIGDWPIPDTTLAQLIEILKAQGPATIGLDLYRNLPVEPGYQQWVEVMTSTPNLVGVEKVIGDGVPAAPVLDNLQQVGMADVVVDSDSKIRRGLLSAATETGELKLGFAATLALQYLEQQGVVLAPLDDRGDRLQLGQATFTQFRRYSGGYTSVDDGGYQVLLNYRGPAERFERVAMREVLQGTVAPGMFRDRIVLIGTVAESLKDPYQSPYNGTDSTQYTFMPGVFIHANLTSQMVSAALDGRSQLQGVPQLLSWLWIAIGTLLGMGVTRFLITQQRSDQATFPGLVVLGVGATGGGLFGVSYLVFLAGWWLPIVPTVVTMAMGTVGITLWQHTQFRRQASTDALTQIANRGFFDDYFAGLFLSQQPLSLLICDVDYFKYYNDTYGHQAGDHCLQRVAQAIRDSIRAGDLVARYGGEEFVVVLPNTGDAIANQIAERIRAQVAALNIPHAKSAIEPYVTLSCGVASLTSGPDAQPAQVIQQADQALYQAKRKGRNQVITTIVDTT